MRQVTYTRSYVNKLKAIIRQNMEDDWHYYCAGSADEYLEQGEQYLLQIYGKQRYWMGGKAERGKYFYVVGVYQFPDRELGERFTYSETDIADADVMGFRKLEPDTTLRDDFIKRGEL